MIKRTLLLLIALCLSITSKADISNLISYDNGYSYHCTSITRTLAVWADCFWYDGEIVQFNIVSAGGNAPIDWKFIRQKHQNGLGELWEPTLEETFKALAEFRNRNN